MIPSSLGPRGSSGFPGLKGEQGDQGYPGAKGMSLHIPPSDLVP